MTPNSSTDSATRDGGKSTAFYGDVIPIHEYAGKQYQPSNGSEGIWFMDVWCSNCARDNEMNGSIPQYTGGPDDHCKHLGDSFIGDGSPEWVFDDKGHPICKQFVQFGEPIVEPDTQTIDMFSTTPKG